MPNRIRKLRTALNIKQIDLAKHLNVSQGTLSNWERGEYDIDNLSLIKMAHFFDCTTDYILGVDNPGFAIQPTPPGGKEKSATDKGDGLDDEEKTLLNIYRELPDDDKDLLTQQAELLKKRRKQ